MKLKLRVGFLIGVLFYVLFFYYFFTRVNFYQIALIFQNGLWYYLLAAILAAAIMIFWQGYLVKDVFRLYNIPMTFKEAVALWLLMVVSGAFTIGLGGPALIFYQVKKIGGFKLASKITTSFYFFYLTPNVLFILLGLFFFFPATLIFSTSKILNYLVLTLLIIALIIFLIILFGSGNEWLDRLREYFIKIKKIVFRLPFRKIIQNLLISTLEVVFDFLIFIFIFKAFQIQINFIEILKNFIVFEIFAIFSPTGGGLGIVEVGLTGSLFLSGLPASVAAFIVLAYRLISFWLPFVLGGVIFAFRYRDIFGQKYQKNE